MYLFNPSRETTFLSTPSARRATPAQQRVNVRIVISIHALREEGDAGYRAQADRHHQISIHALREEGDGLRVGGKQQYGISIHALREEGDSAKC